MSAAEETHSRWERVLPHAPPSARDKARASRRQATSAESVLWRALRSRSLDGVKVRRQVPYGPWVLDFAVLSRKIVIEVDGETHGTEVGLAGDARRTDWLALRGWAVIRFTNAEVLGNLEGVLTILGAALASDPHPGPLPRERVT